MCKVGFFALGQCLRVIAADYNLDILILKLFCLKYMSNCFEMLQIILKANILDYVDLIWVIKYM